MTKKIDDINPDTWVNLEAEVMELWDNDHPAIRQVGILKDSSGIVKFVSWEVSDKPLLVEGEVYRLEGMPVTLFDRRFSVAIVKTTEITRISKGQDTLPTV